MEMLTSMINDGGQLKAQALSKGSGCLDKDILPVQRSNDDFALQRPATNT
jgi:hypothetical protein